MAKNTEKNPNPSAPVTGNLPNLPSGVVWDTVEISGWDFAIPVAANCDGILAICKGDETIAANLFNRALRIAVPARLDGRKVMDEAKDKSKAAKDLQVDILNLDITAKSERAPRTPKVVPEAEIQEEMTAAEVKALLAKHGIKTA